MTKKNKPDGEIHVLDRPRGASTKVLDVYDATVHVGLRTIVRGAAIERIDTAGEETIELPKQRELRAAAAVARCLMAEKLQGSEIKAMRKIMGLTLAEFAARLDERTAPETVSRWEADAQPMGAYADKVLRLVVCETLSRDAPGIEYKSSMLADLHVLDPWKIDPDYQVPPVVLHPIKLKEQSGSIIETWNDRMVA
jgi:DNA-binding transcriptional regulator YiaG